MSENKNEVLTGFFNDIRNFTSIYHLKYFVSVFSKGNKFNVEELAKSGKVNLQKLCLISTSEDSAALDELLGKGEVGEFLNKMVEKHNAEVESLIQASPVKEEVKEEVNTIQ